MKAKICKRPVENEEQKYLYIVKIGLIGNSALEFAIDGYLQEVINDKFLKTGESIDFCYIDEINRKNE